MSLLNQASLIQIPSGYKDGTLYSAKPINGDGDFTFSRGSNLSATRVNSEGLIEKGRENLLLQSNQFDTTWTNTNSTETGGQSGYDGTNNAWLLESTSASGHIVQTISASGLQTYSVYAKAGTLNWIRILITASTGNEDRYFNLASGTIGGTTYGPLNSIITSEGNGWYRCSIVYNESTTGVRVYPTSADLDTSGLGNILIQDAQLEQGLVATDYIPTTTTTAQAGILEDMPRLDYSGGASCGSLLLEPQRTNTISQSEYIDSWTKTNAPTITTNIAIAPDGTNSAGGIQDTTGGTFKRIRQSTSVSANSTNTASVFVKKETIQTNFGGLALTYTGGTAKFAYAIINPVDGTIVVSSDSVIGATSTKAEDYGNWWRFSLTATDNGGNTNLEIAYYATISTNGTSTGVGIGSVRTIWGFQLEIGATYATSYIPTYGASSTRSKDSCSKTGISSLIGQSEGTVFVDITTTNDITTVTPIGISDGTGSNRVLLYVSSGILSALVTVSGVAQATIVSSSISVNTRYKMAIAYKANDFSFYVNGVQIGTDTSGTVPACSVFSYDNGSGSAPFYGLNNQAILFPTRLTNTELADLTTI